MLSSLSVRPNRSVTLAVGSAVAATLVLVASNSSAQTVTVTIPEQPQPVYAQQPPPPPPPPPVQQEVPPPGYVMQPAPQAQPVYLTSPPPPPPGPPQVLYNWKEGDAIPVGYHEKKIINDRLAWAGAIGFAGPYLLSALTAAAAGDGNPGQPNPAGALYVPVLGPFIQMASTSSQTANYFLALDGLAQAAGVGIFIYSMVAPRVLVVRDDFAKTKLNLSVVPMIANGVQGMSVLGTF